MGKGASGYVQAARHIPTGTLLAIKSINIYEKSKRQQLENDLKALDDAACPFLVRYYGAYFEEGMVKLAMELMDLGSLRGLIEKLAGRPEPKIPEDVIYNIISQILTGLNYLHKVKHVMHRDIKPDNVLLNSTGEVKLSDFGICRELGETAAL